MANWATNMLVIDTTSNGPGLTRLYTDIKEVAESLNGDSCWFIDLIELRKKWLDENSLTDTDAYRECIRARDEFYLRGYIYTDYMEYDRENNIIRAEAETAWGALTDLYSSIPIIYDDPCMKVYYLVEELGNGIYETNDVEGIYFNSDFDIIYDNSDEGTTYVNKDDFIEAVSLFFDDPKIDTVQKAVDTVDRFNMIKNNDDDFDESIYFYYYYITRIQY